MTLLRIYRLALALTTVALVAASLAYVREHQENIDLRQNLQQYQLVEIADISPFESGAVERLLNNHQIFASTEGSVDYQVSVSERDRTRAIQVLKAEWAAKGYYIRFR